MKIRLPKPFYTARVGEALSSLTNYVREASRIADEIKPILSYESPGQKDPDAVPPAPKLLQVTGSASSPIAGWTPPGNVSVSYWVTLTGQNLENIHSFALIPAHDLSDGSNLTHELFGTATQPPAAPVRRLPHPSFSALPLAFAGFTHAPPGLISGPTTRYHAWVQDSFGQEDLLFNAL
jgi:hypothetical protein